MNQHFSMYTLCLLSAIKSYITQKMINIGRALDCRSFYSPYHHVRVAYGSPSLCKLQFFVVKFRVKMPSYKLTYFDLRGRAELTRLLFALAGAEYDDCRINGEEWQKLKPSKYFDATCFLVLVVVWHGRIQDLFFFTFCLLRSHLSFSFFLHSTSLDACPLILSPIHRGYLPERFIYAAWRDCYLVGINSISSVNGCLMTKNLDKSIYSLEI